MQLSPHIRDLGRLQLYRIGPGRDYTTRWPTAGPLLSAPIRTELIVEQWDQLLRLVGSMKFGHTTASLLIAKLHAGGRHNALARALHEYGKLVRTLYTCRYLTNLPLRRRVRRQLNKGESLHALRRDLLFAHQGHIRRRHLDDQLDQALCLTVVTNAVIVWATAYLADALNALRAEGFPVTEEAIAHLTPTRHEFLNPYGRYAFDLDAQTYRTGRRPLRRPS